MLSLTTGAIRGHRLAGILWAKGPLSTCFSQRSQLLPFETHTRYTARTAFSWHPPPPVTLEAYCHPSSSSGVPQQSLFSTPVSVVHRATSIRLAKEEKLKSYSRTTPFTIQNAISFKVAIQLCTRKRFAQDLAQHLQRSRS